MDLNGDGIKDILSGSYSRDGGSTAHMAGLFQVLWGTKDGFKEAEPLKGSDGQPLIIGAKETWTEQNITERICTRPFAVDWAGTGKLDLVVGNFDGTFYLFKGEGAGVFNPKAEQLMATDGKPLAVKHHGDPMLVDWDGDGDLDIVSGSAEGGVYLAYNIGPRAAPKFQPFIELIKPSPFDAQITSENDIKAPSRNTRVWAADVNGDGKLDILLGDSVFFSRPAEGLTVAQMNQRQKEWQARYQELDKEYEAKLKDADAAEKLEEEMNKHHAKRKEFVREIMTGYVWLYLQK